MSGYLRAPDQKPTLHIGEKIGKVTVIAKAPKSRREHRPGKGNSSGAIWLVQCDCGTRFHAVTHQIRSGRKIMCGQCHKAQKAAAQ